MDVFLTGFPKKLLVAIAVVVIIAMLVTPTECRTLEKKRHKHTRPMAQTKESHRPYTSVQPVRLRHHRPLNLELTRKKKANDSRAELFKRETRKVFRKLKNTKSFFRYKKEEEMKEYSETAPNWLPTVNFVDIHFHDYRDGQKEAKSNKYEKKFRYIMPKLYKSLVEYEELFKTFQKMELDFPDPPIKSYKVKRKELLRTTLMRLYSTIQEVNDSMTAVGITARPEKLKDFSTLDMKVTNTQCIRIDYLAFRGYGNLLNNWVQQLRCMKKSNRSAIQNLCNKWEEKLREKLEQRKKRQGRINAPPQS